MQFYSMNAETSKVLFDIIEDHASQIINGKATSARFNATGWVHAGKMPLWTVTIKEGYCPILRGSSILSTRD